MAAAALGKDKKVYVHQIHPSILSIDPEPMLLVFIFSTGGLELSSSGPLQPGMEGYVPVGASDSKPQAPKTHNITVSPVGEVLKVTFLDSGSQFVGLPKSSVLKNAGETFDLRFKVRFMVGW